jgi:hypothetical protein
MMVMKCIQLTFANTFMYAGRRSVHHIITTMTWTCRTFRPGPSVSNQREPSTELSIHPLHTGRPIKQLAQIPNTQPQL